MKKGTHSLFPCMLGMVILCVIFTGCTLARIKEPLTMTGTYFDTVIQLQVWDADVRTAFYTTNAIESLNSCYRRLNKQRSVFPSSQALMKALYLSTFEIAKKWTMSIRN